LQNHLTIIMTTTKDESEEDDKTLEEREQWLRDRGVLIETAEDRKAASSTASTSTSTSSTATDGVHSIVQQVSGLQLGVLNEEEDEGSVKFVLVPHDEIKPLQTLMLPASVAKKSGDSLTQYVKPYFADNKSIDASLLQQQSMKNFAGGDLKALADTNLSSAAMNSAAAQGSVETFPLVHPSPDTNGSTGVYIYLDEVGLLKKLPSNNRASQIAAACGFHPAPNFYGDVFMGRVKTQPILANVDFVAGVDTDRSAEWMQRAVSENLAWQQEMNKVTGRTGETQPAHAGTDGNVAAEDLFNWTQDDDEVELSVPFESSSSLAIDKNKVKVTFLPRAVKVKYAGEEKLSIQLHGGIDVDGSTWTIDGTNLVITCEKADAGEIWPRIQ
jgi:hypothetical protein